MNITVENKFEPTSANTIERIHKPTLQEFKHKTISYTQPVIITGKIADWKAFDLWSIDYLNTIVGKKEINVSVSKNKLFTFESEGEDILCTTKMKFTDFTDWLIQEKNGEEYYYLQQNPIQTSFPELFPDIEIPDYIKTKLPIIINLWIGTDGNITSLHWDAAKNLICQLRGRKRILLFEPKQSPFLYPFPVHSKIPHKSQLNIDKPDLEKFPKYQKAKYIECILEPGEMLFIPGFWWHQVYSLEQVNIAVNYWWKANFKDYFTASLRPFMVERPIVFAATVLYQFWQSLRENT